MRDCTQRRKHGLFGQLFLCTDPRVRAPGQVVWESICRSCPFADNGIRTIEPRRLDDIPRGLGDTAADALKIIGIEKKNGCTPCGQRQSWLNQAVSYERLPTLAREGKTWANWLCKLLRIKTGVEPQRILFRFPHGFGDAVQFTVALQHLRAKYPRHVFDVVTKPGTASMFRGLADRAIEQPTAEAIWDWKPDDNYDHEISPEWWDPDGCYRDSPATKAEKWLREACSITPQLELCRYQIQPNDQDFADADRCLADLGATGRAVLIHFQGTTSKQNKNINEGTMQKVVSVIREAGLVPIVLDWDKRSTYARGKRTEALVIDRHNPLWRGTETGDGATLAALASRASLCIGIDSGPGHVFGATDTPTLILWQRHHPLNYYGLSPNVVHVVPKKHQAYIRGDSDAGARFFRRHYRHFVVESTFDKELPEIVAWTLAGERIDTKAKHSTEVYRDVRIRRRLRSGDAMIVDDVCSSDCYQVKELPAGPLRVLDVGAHIGAFGVKVSRKRPGIELACVEPVRANWHLLQANVPHATIFRGACTYEASTVSVASTVNRESRNTGGSSVAPGGDVPAVTLDEIMQQLGWPHIDVLKLDCEGSEISILANTTSLDRIKVIVGEWHDLPALQEIIAARFDGWRYEILRDAAPNGLFRLTSPAEQAAIAKTDAPAAASRDTEALSVK